MTGAQRAAGGQLWVVPGDDQTDLVPQGLSKEDGTRALLDLLDPGAGDATRPLLLAAGDSRCDLGLLGMAELAVVPAHAAPEVRRAGTAPVKHSYQAGLREGVATMLGHDPGGCARCHAAPDPGDAALLMAFSIREAGTRGIPRRLARLVTTSRQAVGTREPRGKVLDPPSR